MKIWLDDIREPWETNPKDFQFGKCYWGYSVNEVKKIILALEEIGEPIELLDLDHDLGDYAADGGDGIKLVEWLDETGRHYPIKFHTMNPVGRQNMQAIIDRW
jgi:hypothetical protein